MPRRAFAPLLAAAAIAFALPAGAQTNVALAETLFREATDLMKGGNFAAACPKLAESQRLDPQLGTLLNLATCHEKEGKTATAWGEFTELLDQAKRRGDTARHDYTQKHLAELESKLSRVRLDPGSVKLDAVKLDGSPLGPAAWTSALPLDAGEHRFDLEADGKHQTLKITVSEPGTMVVPVPPFAAGSSDDITPPPPFVPPPTEGAKGGSPQRTIGFIVGGAGIVGLGVGAIFGIAAMNKKDEVDNHCRGNVCDATGFAAQDDARTGATVSTIGFVAGAALLAGGIALVVTSPKSRTGAISVAPATAGLRLGVTFD